MKKVLKCSYSLLFSLLFLPSAGPHQPHQHLPYARWNFGHVQNGRPQHAGRLHPLPCLWTLQHQVRRLHTHRCLMTVITLIIMVPLMRLMMVLMAVLMTLNAALPREELGLMSCDDISRYNVSSQSGSKGSEAVSYYLDQDSGQFFSLLEGDGPPGPDYDRGRNTGVRRRDKTPTHGKTQNAIRQCEWGSNGFGPVFVL